MRQRLNLNGMWQFRLDPCGEGTAAGYAQPDADAREWQEVAVPSSFNHYQPPLAFYEGAGWYRRSVRVPDAWRDQRVVLRFEGVNQHVEVWVNGYHVGTHQDAFLPFELAVHDRLRFGEDNVIVARVDNERRPADVPGMERGWRTEGGILRDVTLVATDPLHIAAVQVDACPEGEQGGHLAVVVRIANDRAVAVAVRVKAEVGERNSAVHARLEAECVQIPPGAEAEVRLATTLPRVVAWSPDVPELYALRVVAGVDTDMDMDEVGLRFGFRKIESSADGLLLNGRPLLLTGFNRHEDSPKTGLAQDLDTTKADLTAMKQAGANFVRLCHYPHHPGELDLCDELGLLVMGEIPLYWWKGQDDGDDVRRLKFESAKRQLGKMVQRDRNHPSVIFWSVSNETAEDKADVAQGNADLVVLARTLDPSRLAVHVSHRWTEAPHFEADDVICVNQYPSWDARRQGTPPTCAFGQATQYWQDRLAALRRAHPDKPILITEFGCPSIEGSVGQALGEDEQALAIEAELRGMQAPYVCGWTLWCYADHPWPGGEPFVHHMATSPYGVVTRDRRPLRAWATVSRLFQAAHGTAPETVATSSHLPRASANVSVSMVRPNLRDLPDVPFPTGFGIRPMRQDEPGLWLDIVRDSEVHLDLDATTFARQFGNDWPAVERRCFLVTDEQGAAVGTVSAWYTRDDPRCDRGRIHWLAIRPAHQGKGLGKAALCYALHRLAEWHEQCWLQTSTARVLAIRLYLGFGFLPDIGDSAGARAAWEQARGPVAHPVLDRCLESCST